MAGEFWDNPNQQVVHVDAAGPEMPIETPVLTALNPTARVVGPTDDIILHVYGSGFTLQSTISFGGHIETQTQMPAADEVTLEISGDLFTGVDPAVPVMVCTGDICSEPLDFAFVAGPLLDSVTPSTLPYNTDNAEQYATLCVLRGGGFVEGAEVWMSAEGVESHQGTYDEVRVSSTEMRAALNTWTWMEVQAAAAVVVYVINPDGSESNRIEVPIDADDKRPPLAITSPTAGATVEPVHDVLGVALPGSTVGLYSIPGSGTAVATTIADPFGTFLFTGDTPVTPGIDMAWFVRVGVIESAPVSIHVAGEQVYDPGAHTIDDVKAHVLANPDQRDTVYDAETAGKARVTLLEWLEAPP